MSSRPTALDWRVGRLRVLLPIAIHGIALWSALDLARDAPGAWVLVVGVLVSACVDYMQWARERGSAHTLTLIAGGIGIDSQMYVANRAWFGPRCTAVWLRAAKQRRLLYVLHDEVSAAGHAAIRRHLKSLKLD